jgi:hypothetical protein
MHCGAVGGHEEVVWACDDCEDYGGKKSAWKVADMPNPSERLAQDQGRALLYDILGGTDAFQLDRWVE